jgi:multiple antibiotic resistance protein
MGILLWLLLVRFSGQSAMIVTAFGQGEGMQGIWESFLQQSITFAAIMDPVGVSAMMLGMLPHRATHTEAAAIARRSTLTVIVAFAVVFLTGDMILRFFGIDQYSLKVIGGIVLLMMAIEMLGNGGSGRMLNPDSRDDIAVIPLGIPMIFGAGLFTTIIIFRQQATSLTDNLVTIAAFTLNAVVIYLALKYAVWIRKLLGTTGEKVITKLMGIITGAIAVQFIVSGIVVLAKQVLKQLP